MHFLFVDRIAEWIKEQGSWIYWLWCLSVAILANITFHIWERYGWVNTTKYMLLATLLVWLIGAIIGCRLIWLSDIRQFPQWIFQFKKINKVDTYDKDKTE